MALADSGDPVLAETRAWVERAVIGLNLCPFARAVQAKQQVRYVLSEADDEDALLAELVDEMEALVAVDPVRVETTLLVHPQLLRDFLDYNDFLDVVDAALDRLGHAGVLQVASFHPQYQFAGTGPDDVTNATNRSPYPMLQLLRESSIERAVAAFPDTAEIYRANLRTLEALGADGWAALQAQCRRDAEQAPT
ncbi:DUF1415 domain-containing protein [uncultured Methylibium sp.]|uniref:DUF1415 domain-containing protein n=1 Tax=uncultured Methylibium sp. TaxID=381093 RepID=UPI0025F02DFA|nr:DUF1415 domain-containing protein [uncultured Methylibium sp.]